MAVLFLTPVITVVGSLFVSPSSNWAHLLDTVLLEYSVNSALLVLGVAVGVLLLGVSSAWLVSSYNFVGRRWFEWLLLLPLAMPAYIIAYTYTGILDFSGPVQSFIRESFDLSYGDYYFPEIRSLPGAIIMMSLVLYPYVYLLARTAFTSQTQNMHDAAKSLGYNRWQRLWHISLPIARPAIIAGLALALMETLADYGTVQYFAISVLSTGIFRTWFGLNDPIAASQLSAILLIFVVLLLAMEQYARRKTSYSYNNTSRPLQRIDLPLRWQLLANLFCSKIVLFGFFLPFAQLLYWMLYESEYQFDQDYFQLLLNSVSLAAITALAAVMIALALSYMQRLVKNPLSQGAVFSAGLGYAVPGTVIAVGVMIPFSAMDHGINDFFERHFDISTGLLLSGSLFILVFAYLVRFLAVALGNLQAGFLNIHQHMHEASQSLGMNAWQTIYKVHLPLLRPSLLSAALLVFVDTLKELPATLVLRPFNFNTLAVRSYELANDEQLANAAPAVITIVLVGLLPVILLNASMAKKDKQLKNETSHDGA